MNRQALFKEDTTWVCVYPGGVSWRTKPEFDARATGKGLQQGTRILTEQGLLPGLDKREGMLYITCVQSGSKMYLPIDTLAEPRRPVMRPDATSSAAQRSFKVTHPRGVNYRVSACFDDVDPQGPAGPDLGDVIQGQPVGGKDGIPFVRIGVGQYLPVTTVDGKQVLANMSAISPKKARPPPPPPPATTPAAQPSSPPGPAPCASAPPVSDLPQKSPTTDDPFAMAKRSSFEQPTQAIPPPYNPAHSPPPAGGFAPAASPQPQHHPQQQMQNIPQRPQIHSAPAAPGGSLPEWSPVRDPATGGTYWVNNRTRETTWHNPHAPEQSATVLPEWSVYQDASSGKPYWHNNRTNSTTWENPNKPMVQAPPGWQTFRDQQSGKQYWHNSITGETTWNAPAIQAVARTIPVVYSAPQSSPGRFGYS